MPRGKIQIKRIEDQFNRQITYAKRRNSLFKKAREFTASCDGKVSMIIISGKGRLHEYISSSTTTKQMLDLYQKTQGIDLWSPHYEKMEERLKELKETNTNLTNQISVMKGESLGNLSFHELLTLELEMEGALEALREHRYFKMQTQLHFTKKKLKFLQTMHEALRTGFEGAMDDPGYGVVDNGRVYDYGPPRAFASGLNLNQPTEATEAKSNLTTCSDVSYCSVKQPNLGDEIDSVHTSS